MTLRDEIARAVARAVDRALDGERAMTPPPLGEWHPLVTDAVDDIMTAVREALLSDEVIRQVERGTHFAPRVSSVIVTAALDAVTEEDDER